MDIMLCGTSFDDTLVLKLDLSFSGQIAPTSVNILCFKEIKYINKYLGFMFFFKPSNQ